MKLKAAALALLLLPTFAVASPSQKDLHARAQRYLRHQKLMVAALKELLQNDPDKWCKDLTEKECEEVKADQKGLYNLMHDAGKPFGCEGFGDTK